MASEKDYMLASNDDCESSTDQIYIPKRERFSRKWIVTSLTTLLLISLITNVALFFEFIGLKKHVYPIYSGIPLTKTMTYSYESDFWHPDRPNDKSPDAFWDALDTSPIAVALDRTWVKEHNVPVSDSWPWDDEKGLYYVKAFHNMHCLKIIRKAYHSAVEGHDYNVSTHHLDHCFDALRQDTLCRADDTPMPVDGTIGSIGGGQDLKCRDWNKLIEWTQHPDRQACFQNFAGDYQDLGPSLEFFAFCPKDSKYYDIQTQYFEKFGHKPLYQIP